VAVPVKGKSNPRAIHDVPLSREAKMWARRVMPRIRTRLAEANRVPVGVLIWGPGISSSSPLARLRSTLRKELRRDGHAAFFSEELCDARTNHSVRLQQLAQAQEFDLVVSLPCTTGSIAELHDFAADRRVNGKTLVFINGTHADGYANQSIASIANILSCRVERYASDREISIIKTITLEEVQRIREMKYILAGRF